VRDRRNERKTLIFVTLWSKYRECRACETTKERFKKILQQYIRLVLKHTL